MPASILSLRELEDSVALALRLPVANVARALVVPGTGGDINPHGALGQMTKSVGGDTRNPLLDEAWKAGAWRADSHRAEYG